MQSTIKNTVIKNSAILTVVTLVSKLSYYLFFILVARFMGPEAFGQLTFAIILAMAVTRFTNLGLDVNLNKYIAREVRAARGHIENAQAMRFFASLLGLTISIMIILAFSGRIGVPFSVIFIILSRQVMESFRELYIAAIQAHQKMFYQAVVIVPVELVALGYCYLYLQSPDATLLGVSFILLFSSIVKVAGLMTILRVKLTRYGFSFRKKDAVEMIKDSWPIGAGICLAFLMGRTDIFLLTFYEGETQVGYYQAAYTLMDAVVIFFGTIRASLFPNLSYFYNSDRARFFRIHRKANMFFLSITVIGSVVFYFAAGAIIDILYGDSYAESVKVLKIFSLALIFTSLSAFLGNSLIAMDNQRPLMILTVIGCVITVGLNLLLIPRYGIYGSAWANIGTYSILLLMMVSLIESEKRRFAESEKLMK